MLRFYVSPAGDDAWSGTLPDPRADRGDGPFRTPARALGAARALPRPHDPVEIRLRGGTHFLEEPLRLGPEDSGTTLAAHPGERPVCSGGRRISGWRAATVHGRAAWAAAVPEGWTFHALFVNGERRFRPRLPKAGFHRIAALPGVTGETPWQEGQDRFGFAPGDIRADWRNLADVEAVVLHFWVDSHLPVAAVDAADGVVRFSRTSIFRLTDDFRQGGARYYLDNVFEALTEPGEWYLDHPTHTLYYLPLPGEDPERAEVIAPVLSQLIRLEGLPGEAGADAGAHVPQAGADAAPAAQARPVSCVLLQGLTFAHAEWRLPAAGRGGAPQAAADVPAAVHLEHAHGCALRDCTIARCGTYAVAVGPGCRDTAIHGNRLADLGAGGVKVAAGSSGTRITRNEITGCGRTFHAGVGVLIFNSGDNVVADNAISDLYYTGVSVGWVWGYGESAARGNRIERNHIHDIGQGMLNDMGGIYTLGVSPGTVLRGNLIHDIRSDGYGGWGIYLDEGSTDILVEDNLVYRTKTGGFHQHYGCENTIRNNIFAFAAEGQIQRTRIEDHNSFTFEGNIVLWDRGPLLHGAWREPAARFRRNLYWDASGKPVDCGGGRTWEAWRALGMDEGSQVADPRFTGPAEGDFTLPPDSPALRLGFVPFRAGPEG